MNDPRYPFTALVGQEAAKTALLLCAVDFAIGGVLIRGQKGTGKSTAVRGLARLLPDTSLVELPLNATEDRLVGTLHVEHALKSGERRFEPGLLAAADQGILYVDEVNLLDDHLVDMLLDAAASGINRVEREGISHVHPARFMLIGTMNPEEGELRPQFLDRFGLCVCIQGLRAVEDRKEVARRRMDFERDPEAFLEKWSKEEAGLREHIQKAREKVHKLKVPEEMLELAAELALESKAQGHRADITILKAACAHAALLDKGKVEREDILEAARFALPHRMRLTPLTQPETAMADLERILSSPSKEPAKKEEPFEEEDRQVPGATAAGSIVFTYLKKKTDETLFEPDEMIRADDLEAAVAKMRSVPARTRFQSRASLTKGRYVRAAPKKEGERPFDLAVDATLRAAAQRRAREGKGEPFSIKGEDLREKVRTSTGGALTVFLVDASESMGTRERMAAAKGAVLSLLSSAYLKRERVALAAFFGEEAKVLLPPTSSVALARDRLRKLPSGGATPFADGLMKARRIVRTERVKDPGIEPLLVVVSDGEANVSLKNGARCLEELLSLAKGMREEGIRSVAIDTRTDTPSGGCMRELARALGAKYIHVDHLRTQGLVDAVREKD